MYFESLPNEILLYLFEYLHSTDILRAFFGLNTRLKSLIYKQYSFHSFNFSYKQKNEFNEICQYHIPHLINRIYALKINEHFFTYISSFDQFTQLRFLKVSRVPSPKTLTKIMEELPHLLNLTHLTIRCVITRQVFIDFSLIIDTIWNLPKLRYCSLTIFSPGINRLYMPTKISSTLESLRLTGYPIPFNQIEQFMKYTPHLKYLSGVIVILDNKINPDYVLLSLSTLISLNIGICRSCNLSMMDLLLKNLSNLQHLPIRLFDNIIDGYKWEQFIRNYLSKLKSFKIDMSYRIDRNRNIEEYMNRLLNSFQSSFWIKEHQWFMHCYVIDTTIHLHTSTCYDFCYLDQKFPLIWKSTNPNDNQQILYNNIETIDETFFDQSLPLDICLPNIRSITIQFPLPDQFWSIIPNLNHLYTLNIILFTDIYQSELQNILNQTTHLCSLHIKQDPSLRSPQLSFFKCTNSSIPILDFIELNYSLDEIECLLFSRSSLANRCETCFINVQNRHCIVILMKNMPNLQTLNVRCEEEVSITENIQIIQWLNDNLSSTYLITKGSDSSDTIRIRIQ
ncbi:unnamed protein product [Adineta steineri]|uniref:F-box domain-containing protein n=1 Tax=Adineta steineri TaxID=433720 RepID=A0A814GAK5_9BILA|nr:unnamed protein product [Adineta steineri]